MVETNEHQRPWYADSLSYPRRLVVEYVGKSVVNESVEIGPEDPRYVSPELREQLRDHPHPWELVTPTQLRFLTVFTDNKLTYFNRYANL